MMYLISAALPALEPALQYGALGLLGLFIVGVLAVLGYAGKTVDRVVNKMIKSFDRIAESLDKLNDSQSNILVVVKDVHTDLSEKINENYHQLHSEIRDIREFRRDK